MVRGVRHSSMGAPFQGSFNRVSFFFFLGLSLGIVILGKVRPQITEDLRVSIIDSSIPVIGYVSKPIDYVITIIETMDDLANIRDQNVLLREENERLRKGYLKSLQVEVENIHLRRLLSFVSEKESNYISARVVGNTSGVFLRSAVVNVGTENKVRKGQPVVSDKGLIGRIIEVGKRSARILLLTDINSKIPIISSESRERGILIGNNGEELVINYLPEDQKTKVGEIILTSGDGDLFPSGLPIGVVEKVEGTQTTVKPFTEWSRLEYVSVVDY